MPHALPEELRALVKESVALLGKLIEREAGRDAFGLIEAVRTRMVGLRGEPAVKSHQELERLLREFRRLSGEERTLIRHSFTLMLELMNACENAYRAWRIRTQRRGGPDRASAGPRALIYVLTAHPTEARSPENTAVFHWIQELALEALDLGFEAVAEQLEHALAVAWRIPVSRQRKPKVTDEADHIYSVVLRTQTLTTLLRASREVAPLYLRSWVGGDKDGHPGVNAAVMEQSLQLSRRRLLHFARTRLSELRATLEWLPKHADLSRALRRLEGRLSALSDVGPGDARRATRSREAIRAVADAYLEQVGAMHSALRDLLALAHVFPGMVVPLELRDSADLIREAAREGKGAIAGMLRKLRALSRGGDPRWYARGFIISMADSPEDIEAACRLMRRELGDLLIPVIPLLEQKSSLTGAEALVKSMLENPRIRRAIDTRWDGYLEVMVGYSDSAKEMGVLPSRLAISDCLIGLDRLLSRHGVRPIFFHGSGGSVDRGGGGIEEQTAAWPASALSVYKATIQGEMVERSFADPLITRSLLEKTAARAIEVLAERKGRGRGATKVDTASSQAVRDFAARVEGHYRERVGDPVFLDLVQKATAYRYLSALKIGSRPTKRSQVFSVNSLRAIPWVMCWTQVRVLFPTWWGVGSAWAELPARERRALGKAFQEEPLFRSYTKLLGFSLAKVELGVWKLYLEHSELAPERQAAAFQDFEREYLAAVKVVRQLSGSRDLLWFRPWLGESICLRSPMIHPLNVLQLIALEEGRDLPAIRETVTGISSGMMTTG